MPNRTGTYISRKNNIIFCAALLDGIRHLAYTVRDMDRKIVFVFTSIQRKALRDYLSGIYRVARRQNWQIRIVDSASPNRELDEALKEFHPDGAILDGDATSRFVRSLRRQVPGIPLVFMDSALIERNGECGVIHDSSATARRAAENLLALNLPNYAFVGTRRKFFWSYERMTSFRAAVSASGKNCCVYDETSRSSSAADMLRLRKWLDSLPKPCGILAATDERGKEVLDACLAEGIGVPESIAVMGIDNDEFLCENAVPSLSSILPAFQRCGELAAGLLCRKLTGETLDGMIERYGPLTTIVRESTRRFPAMPPTIRKAIEYIRLQAKSGITAQEVVQIIGGSRRTAEIRFRKGTGHSILHEIQEARLTHARYLAENSRIPLGLIANACGYSSDIYLKIRFRRRFGCTMSACRMAVQGKSKSQ